LPIKAHRKNLHVKAARLLPPAIYGAGRLIPHAIPYSLYRIRARNAFKIYRIGRCGGRRFGY